MFKDIEEDNHEEWYSSVQVALMWINNYPYLFYYDIDWLISW